MRTFAKISGWPWAALLWVGAACSIVGMAIWLPVGWDLAIYRQALKDLREGLDPYLAGPARLAGQDVAGSPHYFYLYPPITLKFLQLANFVPAAAGRVLYWLAYAAGFGCQLWAGFQLALPEERRILKFVLPVVVFFPGFMPNEVILCGNVAIPIYGAVLAASVPGWQKNRWGWFYLAVLAGALFKPPLLVLLAVPLFAGRAQILKSAAVAACGVALFGMQRFIWTKEFLEYLSIVKLESALGNSAGHFWSFGFSAAGVLAAALRARGKAYEVPGMAFFLIYGALLFGVLVWFGWQYRRGIIETRTWMTVLLLGSILLSPRILQYDALAVTVPMVLLTIRGWKDGVGRWIVIAGLGGSAVALMANQDSVEISLAMWSLLVAGLIAIRREARVAASAAEAVLEAPRLSQL
ncbi:MAG: hypothetical protein WBS24_12255 [Terriglobales bacterium]